MDKNQSERPMFSVRKETALSGEAFSVVDVKDADGSTLTFNAQPVGPSNYEFLRNASYGSKGQEIRQATFGELVPLVYAAEFNNNLPEAKKVVNIVDSYWLSGTTLALPTEEGLFVDDTPDMRLIGNRILYGQALFNRLGSREEVGVTYSDDGAVRFTPHGGNTRLVALAGNRERADMLAEFASKNGLRMWFSQEFVAPNADIRVLGFGNCYFLGIALGDFTDHPHLRNKCSFGVRRGLAPQSDAQKTH